MAFPLLLALLLVAASASFTAGAHWAPPSSAFAPLDAVDAFLACTADAGVPSTTFVLSSSTSYGGLLNGTIENLRFTEAIQPKPDLIALPPATDEVAPIVTCAVAAGLLLRVRAGGHSYEGQSAIADVGFPFLILDLQLLDAITLLPPSPASAAPRALIQSGATLGQVYYTVSQSTNDAWTLVAGSCPTVGVGGYLSGGGYGLLGRAHGLAVDHIVDLTLVAFNGTLLTRDTMDPEVFWAVSGGGGGSFGVVLDWTVELVPVPPVLTTFGRGVHGVANVTAAIQAWQVFAPQTVDEMYVSFFLSTGAAVRASFSGLSQLNASATLAILTAQFPSLAFTLADLTELSWIDSVLHFAVGLKPNATVEDLMDREYVGKSYFAAKSDYVQAVWTPDAITALLGGMQAHPHAWIMLDPYGGAMSRVSPQATPFPHRAGNLWALQYQAVWSDPSEEDAARAGLRDLYSRMGPYVSSAPRGAYVNYPDFDLGQAWNGTTTVEQSEAWTLPYFGATNAKRLAQAKAMIDPMNVFRNAQSIQPADTTGERESSGDAASARRRTPEPVSDMVALQ